ncbi:MAG: P1 family peptidase [Armatimonadota bacterium]|nr:P1 family peptidase [Armatimonadota bacterium]
MPSLTDVAGVRVGHATDLTGITGCTVVLCPEGAVAACEVRGAAPGTRETSLLEPGSLVQEVHAIALIGGSAFGLSAADGVMRWLEERGIGFDAGVARVPIVPAAVLFDLTIGDARARPDATMAYAACDRATADPVEEGCVGAGTGATVGKIRGRAHAMKGGLGSWAVTLAEGPTVAALAAVNALGDVVDADGTILAGAREPDGRWTNASAALRSSPPDVLFGTNTTLAVVATDAVLTREQAARLTVQGHAGLSRAIVPSHTMFDGDTVFVVATGRYAWSPKPADLVRLGEAAAVATAEAVRRAVKCARSLGNVPAACDLPPDGRRT